MSAEWKSKHRIRNLIANAICLCYRLPVLVFETPLKMHAGCEWDKTYQNSSWFQFTMTLHFSGPLASSGFSPDPGGEGWEPLSTERYCPKAHKAYFKGELGIPWWFGDSLVVSWLLGLDAFTSGACRPSGMTKKEIKQKQKYHHRQQRNQTSVFATRPVESVTYFTLIIAVPYWAYAVYQVSYFIYKNLSNPHNSPMK